MHILPELSFDTNALEPYIDAKTMEIHHDKHHNAYVDNLNKALEKYPQIQEWSIEDLMKKLNELPEDIRTTVRNNGGGHYNHSLFWELLSPKAVEPSEKLKTVIQDTFGSWDAFIEEFSAAAASRFGSGWVWLVKTDSGLSISSTPNQDNPLMPITDVVGFPLLGLDVWEHAYYLNYQNRRADYVKAWWNVVNWDKVTERL